MVQLHRRQGLDDQLQHIKFHPTNEKALWLTDLRLFEVNATRCWSPETVCKGHHFLLFQQIHVMIQLPTHLFLTCNWHQPWRTLNRDLEEEDGETCRLKLGLGGSPEGTNEGSSNYMWSCWKSCFRVSRLLLLLPHHCACFTALTQALLFHGKSSSTFCRTACCPSRYFSHPINLFSTAIFIASIG
ncbi:hypothetical protein MUK42_11026 [Musa troglodytarum]|uniref:Uncharacterized protein n=1 Tax=Musa troglodytarum TaxID=320322 RepID=A0A9E7GR40_9LILI|nr:hypothetical protein MUK42_11026 [Musa troglodytarum]